MNIQEEKQGRRGHHLAERSRKIRADRIERVREYYRENPYSTARECAEALGINYSVVTGYVRALKAGA